MNSEIIVALDYPDAATALAFVDRVGGDCDFYKVGMELFTAAGPDVVRALRKRDKRVFLDLKFHDIPNTVKGGARSAAELGCSILTVHASGGDAMISAAVEGASAAAQNAPVSCAVFAVSILTSLDDRGLARVWGRADAPSSGAEVVRLAGIAAAAGAAGLVCSAHEVRAVRGALGRELRLLVPGLRLSSGDSHDQARVATPRAAQDAGADYLVLGRAVTAASDPLAALEGVRSSLRVAVQP